MKNFMSLVVCLVFVQISLNAMSAESEKEVAELLQNKERIFNAIDVVISHCYQLQANVRMLDSRLHNEQQSSPEDARAIEEFLKNRELTLVTAGVAIKRCNQMRADIISLDRAMQSTQQASGKKATGMSPSKQSPLARLKRFLCCIFVQNK